MTTIYAGSAGAAAAYYTGYLTDEAGGVEVPGRWLGDGARRLGLEGDVAEWQLRELLEGRDPGMGTRLGRELKDRVLADGTRVRAVAGFDATFSAPKSVSWLAEVAGEAGFAAAHDRAVEVAVGHLQRFGATTRVRVGAGRDRQFVDTTGLAMAAFRQSTSRADDPQLHTHVVISAKVQTLDGRWLALDARYLKRLQRTLGGMYQAALRAELSAVFGVTWEPVVNGVAEIAGVPAGLLEEFSTRAGQIDAALAAKLAAFRVEHGRVPTSYERGALEREAAKDTRSTKTHRGVEDLRDVWRERAAGVGWTPEQVWESIGHAARRMPAVGRVEPGRIEKLDDRAAAELGRASTWTRADALRVLCDLAPAGGADAVEHAAALEAAADGFLARCCVELDPPSTGRRRESDGRSVWLEPVAPSHTTEAILVEEERVITTVADAQSTVPRPSTTIGVYAAAVGLDAAQCEAAAVVAGWDRVVLIVGPAGTGKTTTLRAAVADMHDHGRVILGAAPTGRAAQVLAEEASCRTGTLAKLLYEWERPDGPGVDWRLAPEATVIVDEAGMAATGDLARLVHLAARERWRLVLVGDPYQLAAVGRGGLFGHLTATGRVYELEAVRRFIEPWEGPASLGLRAGDERVLAEYARHDRVHPATWDEAVESVIVEWLDRQAQGGRLAVTAATNDAVDELNSAIQRARIDADQLDPGSAVAAAGAEWVHPGDLVVTRATDRLLRTERDVAVVNRATWIVTATHLDGAVEIVSTKGDGSVTVPAEYATAHLRLGYATTIYGAQGATTDAALTIVDAHTTHRDLYVGATRGRQRNDLLVICDEPAAVRDVLEAAMLRDRADRPAVQVRAELAAQIPPVARALVPLAGVPAWLPLALDNLHRRADELIARLDLHEARRRDAAGEVAALQPELEAARTAWQPYANRIAVLDEELRETLRPAMWRANAEVREAGFGRHHAAGRRATQATRAVHTAEQAIDALEAEGAPIKQRLDALLAEARNLSDLADPNASHTMLERFTRDELDGVERLTDALDVWRAWAAGKMPPTGELIQAMEALTNVAHHAPVLATRPGELARSQWVALVEPLSDWLTSRNISFGIDHGIAVERHGPELGIDL